ncbi:MAG: type I-E CRISPR-associated protein Cse1/CasA [Negativicutes bacterium]|nr:type I-E CRISPR-associated protein Cse1/CasA [Negativicutes bacterium]
MIEQEFNLLDEKWLIVIRQDGEKECVSLLELFRRAHEFRDLAGELPTQDVAVLRLLLAILHAVFARYNSAGEYDKFNDSEDALNRWKELWERESFPMPIVERYLRKFQDRFWLFHPQYPFYQVSNIQNGTEYTAAKLNGEIAESNNKIRLFSQRVGESKQTLSYGEAARWLLNINAFDDTSAKPKSKNLPSPGAGWLGKLGIILAIGNNLFETLMLNLTLLNDGVELWGNERPIWEMPLKEKERVNILMPDNLSELLTVQSRRLLLQRDEYKVTGYLLLGGDFFAKENAFNEQMTFWRYSSKTIGPKKEFVPKRHNPERQFWRDLSTLLGQGEAIRNPGVVKWLAILRRNGIMPKRNIGFKIASVKYGDKDFFIDDVFSDTISVNSDLLVKLGEDWVNRIIYEIQIAEEIVRQIGYLSQNLALAAGNQHGTEQASNSKAQAYFKLDLPFRRWLETIDPAKDTKEQMCDCWRNELKMIVERLGKDLIADAGPKSIVGRYIKEKNKETERLCTAASAYNFFCFEVNKILKGGH